MGIESIIREAEQALAALKAAVAKTQQPQRTSRAKRQAIRWGMTAAVANPAVAKAPKAPAPTKEEVLAKAASIVGNVSGMGPLEYLRHLKAVVDGQIGMVEFGGQQVPFSRTVAWEISAPVKGGPGQKAGQIVAFTEQALVAGAAAHIDLSKADEGHGWAALIRSQGAKGDPVATALYAMGWRYRGAGRWVVDGKGVGPSRRFGRATGALNQALAAPVDED